MGCGCGGCRVSWASLARRVSRVGHRLDSVVKRPNNRRHSAVTRSYLSCTKLWCMWGKGWRWGNCFYLRVSEWGRECLGMLLVVCRMSLGLCECGEGMRRVESDWLWVIDCESEWECEWKRRVNANEENEDWMNEWMRNKEKWKTKRWRKKYTLFEHLTHTHTTQGRECHLYPPEVPFAWLFVCVLSMSILGHVCSVFFRTLSPPSLPTRLFACALQCHCMPHITWQPSRRPKPSHSLGPVFWDSFFSSSQSQRIVSWHRFVYFGCLLSLCIFVGVDAAFSFLFCTFYFYLLGLYHSSRHGKHKIRVWCLVYGVCMCGNIIIWRTKKRKRRKHEKGIALLLLFFSIVL